MEAQLTFSLLKTTILKGEHVLMLKMQMSRKKNRDYLHVLARKNTDIWTFWTLLVCFFPEAQICVSELTKVDFCEKSMLEFTLSP